MMLDLTICSVSFDSLEYLNLNRQLTTPEAIDWFVVRNSPREYFLNTLDFHIIDGVSRPADSHDGFVGTASYHHGSALNHACKYFIDNNIYSRYILFIDPDFFIIPTLSDCIDHMKDNKLAVFGAPYAIEPNKTRIQGFPVAFCMFIDREQIDLKTLDFIPRNDVANIVADTGYNVYMDCINKGLKYEAVLPHSGPTQHPHTILSLSSAYGIVPPFKLDEYFWRNRLFGIHCHMKLHLRNNKEIKQRSVLQTVEIKKIVKNVRRQHDTIV